METATQRELDSPVLRRLRDASREALAEARRRAQADQVDGAGRLAAWWKAELLPHLRVEEDVLLPELTRRVSEADALVVFTLGDHVVLRRLARDLRHAHGHERGRLVGVFLDALAAHTRFEELTLLPAIEAALGPQCLARLEPELDAD